MLTTVTVPQAETDQGGPLPNHRLSLRDVHLGALFRGRPPCGPGRSVPAVSAHPRPRRRGQASHQLASRTQILLERAVFQPAA